MPNGCRWYECHQPSLLTVFVDGSAMPLRLILMRHAAAEGPTVSGGDHARRLSAAGRDQADTMADHIGGRFGLPSAIRHSDATRTTETTLRMGSVWRKSDLGEVGDVRASDELYLSSPATILRIAGETLRRHDTVLIVAHNPGISSAAGMLTGDPRGMPTATVVSLVTDDVDDSIRDQFSASAIDWRMDDWTVPADLM